MARFVGNFEHTLDEKGRLILPSAFRPKLAEGAFITPLDHCLAILPAEEFDRMADRLESQVAAGGVDVNALRHFASQADEVMLGRQVTRTTRSESESTWGFRHGSGRYVPLSSGGA